MVIHWKHSRVHSIILFAIIAIWIIICVLEKMYLNDPYQYQMGATVIRGELATQYRINLFDRRKSTVILMYSKEDDEDWMKEVTTLDHKVVLMNSIANSMVIKNRSFSVLPMDQLSHIIVCRHNKSLLFV